MKRPGVVLEHDPEKGEVLFLRGLALVEDFKRTTKSPVVAMETMMAAIQILHQGAPEHGKAQILDCLRVLLGQLGSAPGDA